MLSDIIVSSVTGILSSLVASIVWFYLFTRLKPKVTISSKIAKFKDVEGKTVYKIKIINRSRRAIVGVKGNLVLVVPVFVKSGTVRTIREIPLKIDEMMSIPGFNVKDSESRYAFRFLTYEDIEALWDNDQTQYLSFRFYAEDSISGLRTYLEKRYLLKRDTIVDGDFVSGNSFDIV